MKNKDIKIGRKAGKSFLNKFKEAEDRIFILSPWLSTKYTNIILDKNNEGVDVNIVTTNNYIKGHKSALKNLTTLEHEIRKEADPKKKKWGVILMIIGVIISFFTTGITLIISLAGLIIYLLGKEKTNSYWVPKISNLDIYEYHPGRSLHAKVYIADNTLILGSANLTKGGLERNLESVVIIEDKELASEAIEEIESVKEDLKQVSIEEVGNKSRIQNNNKSTSHSSVKTIKTISKIIKKV